MMQSTRLLSLVLIASFVLSCRSGYEIVSTVKFERVGEAEVDSDVGTEAVIIPYRDSLNSIMNEVIGQLSTPLVKQRPESNIGNWLADMMRDEAEIKLGRTVDFAIQNYGGIRVTSLAPGPLTIGEIFEIMPFDNMLVFLEADSAKVHRLFDHIAESGGWPVSKGVSFVIDGDKSTSITLRGEPMRSGATYLFALPDYVANGGSGSFFLKEYDRMDSDIFIRDLFIENIRRDTRAGLSQSPVIEGRIQMKENE